MELRGGVAGLWHHKSEGTALVEGGVNTGKSHGVFNFALWYGEEFPGARILFLRKIRADLIESALIKPWESTVIDQHLALGVIKIEGGAKRGRYVHQNGSVWVPGGLDKSSRHMGAQWDLILFCEGTEATEDDYEDLLTRTSREAGVADYSFIIFDVNPASENHWINQKAKAGHMKRYLSRHEDNPLLFDIAEVNEFGEACKFKPTEQGVKFLSKLEQLTGSRKERLKYHRWATSEGLVWPEYQIDVHRRSRELTLPNLRFKKFIGGFDWGYNDPACFQVWGVEARTGQLYLVYEVYRRQKGMNWWAARFIDVYDMCRREFGVAIADIITSHERPEHKNTANDLFQRRGLPRICKQYKAKSIAGRLEKVRWFLQPEAAPAVGSNPNPGAPMMYFLSGSRLFEPDDPEELGYSAVGVEEEIPGYVWEKTPDGRNSREKPAEGCPDHGCDTMGMVVEEAFNDIRFTEDEGLDIEPAAGSIGRSELEERRILGLAEPKRRKRR